MPCGPHRMGAILDHGDAKAIADRHQRRHVADMPAHVGQQQDTRATIPRHHGQMVQIDGQIIRHFDKHRDSPD